MELKIAEVAIKVSNDPLKLFYNKDSYIRPWTSTDACIILSEH